MASPTKETQKAAYSIADSGKNNIGTDKSKMSGRLFFLDAGGGRVFSANPDGSDLKTIINEGRKFPDGLVVDTAAGHIYWTNWLETIRSSNLRRKKTGCWSTLSSCALSRVKH